MTREEATKLVDEYRRSLMDFCSVNYVLPKVSPEKGDRLNDAAEAIIAALTTPAPQGEWVTVPRKATVQMAEAAERESVKHRTAGPAYFEFAYEAMLAAAPQPPQPEPHTDDVALVDALANAVEDFLKTPYDLTASILKDRRTALLSHLTALRADRDAVIEECAVAIKAKQQALIDVGADSPVVNAFQSAISRIRALKGK